MNKTMVLLAILTVLPIPIYATTTVLPIINQDEFKSCFFDWCQTTAPSFLLTDVNFTFANYSYISIYSNYTDFANQSNFSYYVNNDTERNLFTNTFNLTYDAKISDNTSFNQTMLYPFFVNITYYNTNPFNYLTSSFNISYDLKFNTTAITNLNMTTKNITFNLAGSNLPTCQLYYNTTGSLIFCDCYNNTHKWVANSC